MAKEQECEQGQLHSTFEASACIIFADIPITKVSHMARSRSPESAWQSTGRQVDGYKTWCKQVMIQEMDPSWNPGVLQFMGSQRAVHDWTTEKQQHSSSFQMSTM